jgi:hypothetical protein
MMMVPLVQIGILLYIVLQRDCRCVIVVTLVRVVLYHCHGCDGCKAQEEEEEYHTEVVGADHDDAAADKEDADRAFTVRRRVLAVAVAVVAVVALVGVNAIMVTNTQTQTLTQNTDTGMRGLQNSPGR